MQLGIVSDFHLGGTRNSQWNNRQMQLRATELAQAAIATLNAHALDAVVVTGDLTEDGHHEGNYLHQLLLARELLETIRAPWYVVPGNHDRLLVQSGDFDRVFSKHVLDGYTRWNEFGVVGLREWLGAQGHTFFKLGAAQIDNVVSAVKSDVPEMLVLFSHFPLLSEERFGELHGGRYPGHLEDGALLLEQLAQRVQNRIVIFCGHMHWHCITSDPRWIHCTTGGMIEYPMELRIVSLEFPTLQIATLDGAARELAAQSLLDADWVRGETRDREGTFLLSRS